MTPVRDRSLGIAQALVVLGWAAMAAVGTSAIRTHPEWIEEQYRCRLAGECTAGEIAAQQRLHWWLEGVAGAAVLAGVVLLIRSLPSESRGPRVRRLGVPAHAALAGVAAALLMLLLTVPGMVGLLMGPHAAVATAVGIWLAQALVVSTLHRSFAATTSARRTVATGLGVSAVALGVMVGLATQDWSVLHPWWSPAATDAAGVTLLIAFVRLLGDPLPGREGAARRRGVAVSGVVVAAALALVATVPALRAPDPDQHAGAPSSEQLPPPDRTAPESPPVPTAPTAGPEPGPTEPVLTDDRCVIDELAFVVTGFDAAMGARSAAVLATNTGARPCFVDGFPAVNLVQGGRPLALTVEHGSTSSPGTPGTAQRVGIAPGGAAVSGLYWRSYGGLADDETAQSVTVALDGSQVPVHARVDPPHGTATPFDIADGGTWQVGNWAPAAP